MAKYVVCWKKVGDDLCGIPVDERFHCDTSDKAVTEARTLVAAARDAELVPDTIIQLEDDSLEDMIISDRPMLEWIEDIDFVVLRK